MLDGSLLSIAPVSLYFLRPIAPIIAVEFWVNDFARRECGDKSVVEAIFLIVKKLF